MPVATINDLTVNYKLDGARDEPGVREAAGKGISHGRCGTRPAAGGSARATRARWPAIPTRCARGPRRRALLGIYGILGLIIMYLMANLALIIEWVKFRRRGVAKSPWLRVITP